jgi:TIR domain
MEGNLARIELLDKIGRELQSRFGYQDIDAYLRVYGAKSDPPYSGSNSKWLYSKYLLRDASLSTLGQISSELGIEGFKQDAKNQSLPPRNWSDQVANRCFISHLSKDKIKATRLRDSFTAHGINAFVAHEDIHPTAEWAVEIIRALRCMDFFVSVHTKGFSQSVWCQQEVGFALARGIPMISLRMGEDPVGFQSAQQALSRGEKTAEKVAEEMARIFTGGANSFVP